MHVCTNAKMHACMHILMHAHTHTHLLRHACNYKLTKHMYMCAQMYYLCAHT